MGQLTLPKPETKQCSQCNQWWALSEFNRNKLSPDGLHPWCKSCRRVSRQEFYKANTEYVKAQQIWRAKKHRYGITREQFEAKVAEQSGLCAICGQRNGAGQRLCLDHNHETGAHRGLLCHKCNMAIGLLRDRPELFESAAQYLRRWSSSQ